MNLPEPSIFYQAWTRRLMNDKTDTLDAIAREMRGSAGHYGLATAMSTKLHAWADRITALSNQGEGAVVSALEVFRISGGDVECAPNPSAALALDCLRDLRQCYDEQPEAEADRRDAEANARAVAAVRNQCEEWNDEAKAEGFGGGNTRAKIILEIIDAAIAATQEQT